MTRRIQNLLLLLIIVLIPSLVCHAQSSSTATIIGTVVDPKGAVVQDAAVVARNVDTGIERTTRTSTNGLYRFDNLPPGVYTVAAEAQGFARAETRNIQLQVGDQRDVNFTLVISAQVGQVTVTSEVPLVESTKTDVSMVIDSKQVDTLPTTTSFNGIGGVSNDYAGLAALAPGVKYDFSGNSSDLVGPGAVNNRGVLVNVDGGNITDQVVSTRDALGASIDEVQEFQVLTNNYNAEYGQAGGVILNVITKSGTNALHGDGHIYFRGRNLGANNFFYNTSTASQFRRAPFFKREGGFTLGGPIIKERTFFFLSYELTHQGSPAQLTPPGGIITVNQPTNELLWSAKIDHQLTKKHRLSARFNVQRDLQDNLIVQVPNFALPESLTLSDVHDHTLNITGTSTLSSRMVNEARFFWHRFINDLPTKTSQPGQLGPNFYRGAAFCCPQGGLQNRYQYVDNLSITHGTHTVKTGFDISHFPYFSLFQQFHFGRYEGFPHPAPGEGLPTQFTIGLGPGQVNATDNIYGLYVQDTWKIRPNITLNYGLRYDVEKGAFKGGKLNGGCLQGNGIIVACSSDNNNFQPRLGIAYSPRFNSGFLHTLFGGPDKTVIRLSAAEITQLAYLNIVLDSLNFDGTTLFTTTIKDPAVLAFFPNLPPASVLAQFTPTNRTFFGRVRPISNDLRNPETRHINFTISRQFGNNFVLDVGYLGVFGFGLFGERDRNFPIIKADPAHPGFFYFGPRPDPRFAAIRTNENSRTSSYNGFLLHATKRFSNHFQFQAGYVLSKQLASSEDFYGTSEPGDPNNIRAERALAQNDVRHQVNFGVVYDTQKLTQRRLFRYFVNNWTVGLIGQLQSGRPYPLSTGDAPFAGSIFPGVGAETQQRPNVLADGTIVATNIASTSGTNLLISEAGLAMCPGCPQTTFLAPADADPRGTADSFTGDIVDFQFINGNLGRNVAKGDPYYRFDMSFVKGFPIREKMRLELKVDIFNILNQTNFLLFNNLDTLNNFSISADPNCRSCLNAHTGRYIGSDGRVLHIQDLQHGRVSPDVLNPIFAGIGDPAIADIPRTFQIAIRFKF